VTKKKAQDDLRGRLAAHRFLHGLTEGHLAAVAACAREERFKAGERLLAEGDVADRTFLLEQGQVALEVHAPGRGALLVATAGAGELVGWSWINAPSRWHMDARATDDTRALVLDGPRLVDRCEADPALGWALAKRFLAVAQQRLVAMRLQALDLYGVAR
jgi:CRP/FNR family transcriptional regulator, cyclic AMP receptor protein